MAVNALVIRNGIPVPVNREQFLHMDEGLSIEVGSNNLYRGKGKVYLTNFRLIFLKRDPSRAFSSFSLPYLNITKQKYGKKLLGGPVVSGTVKSVTNGGLANNAKWQITFNDSNTGKAFYSLFEKELQKLNRANDSKNDDTDRYKRVCNTPTLSVQQIFPDQWSAYQRQQRHSNKVKQKQIVLNQKQNISKSKSANHIIVGQSADDAPMQLTHDFRAQKAKLFSSSSQNNVNSGPIIGASPVNINAFRGHRIGKHTIQDETTKYHSHNGSNEHSKAKSKDDYAAPAADYQAFVDPSNPDDIVLSVPMNDNAFGSVDEGKSGDYMYGIGQKYEEKHGGQIDGKNVVAVSVGDEEESEYSERPKVHGMGVLSPMEKNELDLNAMFEEKVKVKVSDNPWGDNNGNVPDSWQKFHE